MSAMFNDASLFNSDLSRWDVSQVRGVGGTSLGREQRGLGEAKEHPYKT